MQTPSLASVSDAWKLLVLEDDANLRQVLSDLLEDEGYQVVAVDNGAAAVQLASEESFDLIIADIRMDGVDGLEALERARGYQPELSSLVVSGYTTEAETLRALQLNVGGYLKKPFSLADFLQRTRELLTQRRVLRQHREAVSHLRHSLWWALQSASGASQEEGRLALFLARQVGLTAEQAQNVRLATLLSFRQEGPWSRWPANAARDTLGLSPVLQLIQEVRQAHSVAPSLSAQVVLLVRGWVQGQGEPRSGKGEPPPWPWHELLQSSLEAPEMDSPQVLSALAAHEKDLGLDGPARLQRSLMGLALTLEERGDLGAAMSAYERLAQGEESAPETRLQARVGQARVGWLSGQADWYETLKEAERASRSLGPLAGALQRWPIATILLRSGHASAEVYLRNLETELEELGLKAAAAKARLARARLRPEGVDVSQALPLLLGSQQVGEVAKDSDWLVAAMLTTGPHSGVEPGSTWCRLAGEFPQSALRWLKDPQTQTRALEYLLQSFEGAPELAPTRLVEALAEHPQPALRQRAVALRGNLHGQENTTFLRFRSFGCFDVYVNGERVPDNLWKTQKFKFMLAYLVARRGQAVPEDVLIEEFWPDSHGSGKASVYAATTTVRRCLRAGQSDKTGEFILREGEQLTFDANVPCWHDLEQFEQASAALQNPSSDSLTTARQVASLLTGPYLQGCYLDWAQRRRLQLDEMAIRFFAQLAQSSQESRPQESLDYAQRGLELDPLSQDCHLQRMLGFLKLGQPENAIKQFNLCQRELQREVGLEPLTSLLEVYYRAKLALP